MRIVVGCWSSLVREPLGAWWGLACLQGLERGCLGIHRGDMRTLHRLYRVMGSGVPSRGSSQELSKQGIQGGP